MADICLHPQRLAVSAHKKDCIIFAGELNQQALLRVLSDGECDFKRSGIR